MDFITLAEERYSVRKFSSRPVEDSKIEAIIKAGCLAPTACNRQPQRIYVLRSSEALERLQKCKTSHFGETLAILVTADKTECWIREYDGKPSLDVDASIVLDHMMMAAWDEEIGSTWIMHFIPEAVRTEFDIPENEEPVGILVMGYKADDAMPSPLHSKRKKEEEIVRFL